MNKDVGYVHSFESFGTVDGPGVRFVIFFQGCHLKCKYCHNRDLWPTTGAKAYSVDQLIEQVKSYKPFFSDGGGVTVSGGDPILQSNFIKKFFKKCKEIGIHTVLDTSGAVSITNSVKELLNLTSGFSKLCASFEIN